MAVALAELDGSMKLGHARGWERSAAGRASPLVFENIVDVERERRVRLVGRYSTNAVQYGPPLKFVSNSSVR